MSRYDLTDFEWNVIEPLLPNKPRGVPPCRRSAGAQRHHVGVALQRSLARSAGALRALHYLLQLLQSLAQERHLGSPDGRHRRSLRR